TVRLRRLLSADRDHVLGQAVQRQVGTLAGRPQLALDDLPRHALGADRELNRHADEIGVRELHTGTRLAVVVQDFEPHALQFAVAAVAFGAYPLGAFALAGQHDEVHVVRRERGRPREAVLVAVAFGNRLDDA